MECTIRADRLLSGKAVVATIGHIAVGAAIARGFAESHEPRGRRLRRMLIAAMVATLPDADLALRALGVPSGDQPLAHRGASHSVIIGPGVAVMAWLVGARLQDGVCYGLSAMSHGFLDTLSQSERGVALAWPLSRRRFTSPYQPVLARALPEPALQRRPWAHVIMRELIVFAPAIAIAAWPGPRGPFRSR